MSAPRSAGLLQALLTLLGVVALGAGIYAAATGVGGMPGADRASANVDSELRFFAVFWSLYGVLVLRVAPRVAREKAAIRGLMLALFVAGLARAVSWLAEGQPDARFVALMCVELILPPVVVAWQARLATA